jgi:bifunctional non-homologous end joining protein LigD
MMLSPELATPLDLAQVGRYVVDDEWVMEQKLDGHRIMLISSLDGGTTFLTRNGTEYTKGVPAALHLHGLPPGFIVDGELVNGVLWIFDVIHLNGHLESLPLEERRKVLNNVPETAVLRRIPQAVGTAEKERLLMQAASHGYEGVILKKLSSPYERNRRSPNWLKAKFVVTADVIVLSVGDDGKESASLGAVDGQKVVEVGRCSLIGKPAVVPGDVVEVRYLYANDPAKPRLYQPTLLKVRDDKTPPECLIDQLRFTNKTVMEALT